VIKPRGEQLSTILAVFIVKDNVKGTSIVTTEQAVIQMMQVPTKI
jgi:hypothetical protein